MLKTFAKVTLTAAMWLNLVVFGSSMVGVISFRPSAQPMGELGDALLIVAGLIGAVSIVLWVLVALRWIARRSATLIWG